ncbi:MAG TPA: type II toxin-antitoxin system RelE/ParE family toxin [Armatimonadota bacterium]|nr:type II toxin-antitoxin system RelE/ParE family toxin [Armatimonadota bacterium]
MRIGCPGTSSKPKWRRYGKLPEYRLEFTQSAAKEFRSLSPGVKQRVAERVDSLVKTPRPRGSVKLKGHEHYYRLRAGAYRIVYEVNDEARMILVTRIRHRSEVYE